MGSAYCRGVLQPKGPVPPHCVFRPAISKCTLRNIPISVLGYLRLTTLHTSHAPACTSALHPNGPCPPHCVFLAALLKEQKDKSTFRSTSDSVGHRSQNLSRRRGDGRIDDDVTRFHRTTLISFLLLLRIHIIMSILLCLFHYLLHCLLLLFLVRLGSFVRRDLAAR